MAAISTQLCSSRNDNCERVNQYRAGMQNKATIALRDNVRRLMQHRGMSQRDLAEKADLSQSSIGYLLRYKDEYDRHPSTETIEAIASVFDLEAWQLMVPDLPLEILESRAFAKMVENYRDAPAAGRANVERVAESEVKYAVAESVLSANKSTGTHGG